MTKRSAALILALAAAAAGCARTGDIDPSGGVSVVRTACPAVAVPAGTGDVTLFDPPATVEASALDVSAAISNVRSTCNDAGAEVVTTVTFDVRARRARSEAAREVVLPYFVAVVRGGTAVTAKRVGQVAVRFEAGQAVGTGSAQATTVVSRAAATLSEDTREKLTRRRKAGDEDAALDPLSDPAVRQAVLAASFEALVGFQLTDAQLRYNATR